ncbi:MAG TPA: hypothetical protein VFR85_09780 [Anaeromyxobacteraceae bacterium]|nr:hypothetical protein [Anaeromyxobacteraceae bacterium]
MQTAIHTGPLGASVELLPAPPEVLEPVGVAEPLQARQAAFVAEKPLFQSVTCKKAPDTAVFGLLLLLWGGLLAAGFWMVADVARGLAMADRCNGQCVEVAR